MIQKTQASENLRAAIEEAKTALETMGREQARLEESMVRLQAALMTAMTFADPDQRARLHEYRTKGAVGESVGEPFDPGSLTP